MWQRGVSSRQASAHLRQAISILSQSPCVMMSVVSRGVPKRSLSLQLASKGIHVINVSMARGFASSSRRQKLVQSKQESVAENPVTSLEDLEAALDQTIAEVKHVDALMEKAEMSTGVRGRRRQDRGAPVEVEDAEEEAMDVLEEGEDEDDRMHSGNEWDSLEDDTALESYEDSNAFTDGEFHSGEKPRRVAQLIGGEGMYSFELQESDLSEHFVRGSGPGGQAVNKTRNCVVLKHEPTGTIVKCQQTRSLDENRHIARKIMREKLEAIALGPQSKQARRQQRIRRRKLRTRRRHKHKTDDVVDDDDASSGETSAVVTGADAVTKSNSEAVTLVTGVQQVVSATTGAAAAEPVTKANRTRQYRERRAEPDWMSDLALLEGKMDELGTAAATMTSITKDISSSANTDDVSAGAPAARTTRQDTNSFEEEEEEEGRRVREDLAKIKKRIKTSKPNKVKF